MTRKPDANRQFTNQADHFMLEKQRQHDFHKFSNTADNQYNDNNFNRKSDTGTTTNFLLESEKNEKSDNDNDIDDNMLLIKREIESINEKANGILINTQNNQIVGNDDLLVNHGQKNLEKLFEKDNRKGQSYRVPSKLEVRHGSSGRAGLTHGNIYPTTVQNSNNYHHPNKHHHNHHISYNDKNSF